MRKSSETDRAITIKWNSVDCRHRNGEIVGYNVTYYLMSDMQRSQTVTVFDHSFTAVGLLFNENYSFEVQAISQRYGVGPAASISVSTSPLQGKYS